MDANKPYKIVAVGPYFVGCVPCGTLFELMGECATLPEAQATIEKDQIHSFRSFIIGTVVDGDFSSFSRKAKVDYNGVIEDVVMYPTRIEVGGEDLFYVNDRVQDWTGAYMKFDPDVRVRGWRFAAN
jgi:hypothetical protein